MIQTKRKQILLAVAVLAVLSFAAVMVLHKHEEPKVIGKFSQAEVSEISDIVLNVEWVFFKDQMKDSLKRGNFRDLVDNIRFYHSIHVSSITAMPNGEASVTLGYTTNASDIAMPLPAALVKVGEHWRFP